MLAPQWANCWAFGSFCRCDYTSLLQRLLLFVLLSALAIPTLTGLVSGWENNPDYAHGWFLVPALGWLLWQAQPWNCASKPESLLGSLMMLSGGVLHLGTLVIPLPLVDYAAWVLLLRGVALCLWGRSGARALMPILAFGFLLFPLPMVWLNSLAMLLQDVIAQVAEYVLGFFWVCLRRGPLLQLAGMDSPVSVAVECSGVRQLLVFLALAWFLSLHLHGPWWKKLALCLASFPIAIVANVIRVIVLVVVARQWGNNSIDGLLHNAPLLITLPAGAVLLWWMYQQLQQPSSTIAPEATCTSSVSLKLPILLSACLLLMQGLLYYHLQQGSLHYQVEHILFDQLPWQLGSWNGTPHPEQDRIEKQATFADATMLRAYSNKTGQAAAVYLVYSASGRDRLHHPEICLRDAGGASEWKPGHRMLSLDAQGKRQVERLCYERQRNQRTTVYYWHYTMIPPRASNQTLLQRLHWMQQDQWPSITIQVQTNTTDGASWQSIEETLLHEIDRWLCQQLPAGTQTGSQRLPIRFTLLR
jgi:EpsI family protein